MTIFTELDSVDINHNNLVDPHITLPREKKERTLGENIWLTSHDYISTRLFRFNYSIEESREYRFNKDILD